MHAVFTGPIRTDLTLSDGQVIDVRPDIVYLDTPEQAAELAQLIGDYYAEKGHPAHDDDAPFIHDTNPGG